MSSCVPAGATILGGVDLARLRSSPLYGKLPPAAAALLETEREARYLMIASDGKNLLTIARGPFRRTPAGATLLAGGVAIAGTPEWMEAAAAQHKSGKPGAPALVSGAADVAGAAVWISALGGRTLPLSGNAANLNRLLRNADRATISLRLDSPIELALTVLGRTADAAREVEDTLRATITLAAASEAGHPDLAALLRSIRLSGADRTVRASLSATPEEVQKLLGALLS